MISLCIHANFCSYFSFRSFGRVWNEQGVLKAIFVRYMDMLIEDAGQEQYLAWLQKSAVTAWINRDKSRTLMYRDYDVPCPTGDIQSYEASSAVGFMQVIPPPAEL